MRRVDELTKALEDEVPFVKEVTSLSNVEFMEGAPPDDILVYDLLDEFPETQEDLFVIRDKVMKKPLYVGGLVSSDSELGAIIVETDRSSIAPLEELRLDPDGGDGLSNLYPQVTFEAIEDDPRAPRVRGLRVLPHRRRARSTRPTTPFFLGKTCRGSWPPRSS